MGPAEVSAAATSAASAAASPAHWFDEADAILLGRRLSQKLIDRDAIPESGQAYLPEILTGLLLLLWPSQKVGRQEPDLLEARAALISDVRDNWSPLPDRSTKQALDSFVAAVDQTFAEFDAISRTEEVRVRGSYFRGGPRPLFSGSASIPHDPARPPGRDCRRVTAWHQGPTNDARGPPGRHCPGLF
jgi:hypothetical protein